jgi:acylphosphatase
VSEGSIVQKGFRVTGRVQGVFFRAWTREVARELGLGGTVRNLPDGSVVAHFVGPAGAVERMEGRLWEGPPASRVDAVEPVDSRTALQAGLFQILH